MSSLIEKYNKLESKVREINTRRNNYKNAVSLINSGIENFKSIEIRGYDNSGGIWINYDEFGASRSVSGSITIDEYNQLQSLVLSILNKHHEESIVEQEQLIESIFKE